MKIYNKFLNIIIIIEIIILNFSRDVLGGLYIYKTFATVFGILCISNVISNIIIAIKNFTSKKRTEAIVQLLIVLVLINSFIINKRIISIILSFIALIFEIINLISNKKENEKNRSKTPIIICGILASVQILVFVIPIIMNAINLNNLKEVLSIIETQTTIKTTVKKEADEYVFYLKKGKEISRAQFDEMFINENNNELCGMVLNGNRLEVGVARKGNRIVIVNSQGKEIFELCNICDNYKDVAEKFMYYIGQTHKFGIDISFNI